MGAVTIRARIIDSPCATAPDATCVIDAADDGTPLRHIVITHPGELTSYRLNGRTIVDRVGGGDYPHELVEVDEHGVPTYRTHRP